MAAERDPQTLTPSSRKPTLVPLPCDLDQWPLLKTTLGRLCQVYHTADLISILDHAYNIVHRGSKDVIGTGRTGRSAYLGLVHFLDDVASNEERGDFFRRTLPTIVNLALCIGDVKPNDGFYFSEQQRGGDTRLSRRFIASLLAHHFLCTQPRPAQHKLNPLNFKRFFYELERARGENSQTAKLRCILHYFDRVRSAAQPGLTSNVTFTRKVLAKSELPMLCTWQDSRLQLCPLVMHRGLIEETGSATLQVDFANRLIGGGVLGGGCVQEEIRFCICPELLASLIFMESMEDNEAISITGYEQFSSYRGYGTSLRFDGDFQDSTQRSSSGDVSTMLVAIDATDMDTHASSHHQYTDPALLRELNKAYIGFLQTGLPAMDGNGEDLSDSLYFDAVDQSQISNDGDFETASEGLDSLTKPVTPCISAIVDYSNSLSRAITDIAVKDYCQGKRNQYTQCEPLADDMGNEGVDGHGMMAYHDQKLDRFASSVAGNVLKEGFEFASLKMTGENSGDNSGLPDMGEVHLGGISNGRVDRLSDDIARGVVEGAILSSQRVGRGPRGPRKPSNHRPDGDADGISQSLSAIIDDIVSVVIREALAEIAGMCVSESGSTRGPSLGGYSVISTWSSKSDSFVKIDMDSDFSGTRSLGSLSSINSDRHGMSVEAYVSGVVSGAVQKMKEESSSNDASERTLVEISNTQSLSDPDTLAGKIVEDALKEWKSQSNGQGQAVRNSCIKSCKSNGLDAYAASIADIVCKQAIREVSVAQSLGSQHFSQFSTIPSTPPPSPSNASTGSSKRFSLEDPSQLEEFAEKLLSSITPDSEKQHYAAYGGDVGSQRLRDIEDFASNVVSRAVEESTHHVISGQVRRESSSGCISSRSSLTVPSTSSKRSSVDSFTEDLLRIGNIDPTGRRPSKTEENMTFFSQELARVNEVEERLGQRRKSDLEEFQQELFQSSKNLFPNQKSEVTQSRIRAANRLANRLADDIICDAFLHLYGATPFRELIRLDSLSDLDSGAGSRRRSYPRRGNRTSSVSSASMSVRSTISEMDLVTLATNLANSIIESAIQTYRDEYLARQRGSTIEITGDDGDSQMQDTIDEVSIMATYDGSTTDQQEAIASMVEIAPEISLQETASSLVGRAVQDAVVLYQASMSTADSQNVIAGLSRRPIATGNWGCGAFGGDPQLKSVIQWLAASQCRAPSIFYCTMSDERIRQLEQVTVRIQTRRWSVGDLMRIVVEYCHLATTSCDAGGLFDYILGLQC